MINKLKFAAKVAVLSFAATVSLLPTAASALPTHERLINYLDEKGQVIGELLTTCNGRRYYTGTTSSQTVVVYEAPCDPEGGGGSCMWINGMPYCP